MTLRSLEGKPRSSSGPSLFHLQKKKGEGDFFDMNPSSEPVSCIVV